MSTEKYIRKIRTVIPLEHDWGTVLQKLVLEAADDLARHQKPRERSSDQETIDIKVPVTIHFDFPMIAVADAGAGDAGGPRCICIFKQYPDGGSVCICIGPGAADCDCESVGGPIVA